MDIKKQKIISVQYSIGEIATLILELMATYVIFFMTTTRLMNPSIASSLVSIAMIIAAFAGVFVGYTTDRTNKSKRSVALKNFFLAIACFILFYAPLDLSSNASTVYCGVFLILFYIFFVSFLTPYDAIGGEIVTDYNVRTFMRSMCLVGIYIGVLFADTLSTYIRTWFTSLGISDSNSWFFMVLIMGGIAVVAMLFACQAIKKYEPEKVEQSEKSEEAGENIIKAYIETLKIKPVRALFIWTIVYYMYVMLVASLTLYFGIYVLGLSEAGAATLFTISVVATFAISPLATIVAGKIGKKASVNIVMMIYIVFAITLLFKTPSGFIPGVIFAIISSIVNVTAQTCSFSMLYDTNELVEYKLGQSRATETMGLYQCGNSLGLAIGSMLLGALLSIGKFDGTAAIQSQQTIDWIMNGVIWIPIIIFVISMLVMNVGYKINEKNHAALVEALNAKKAGKEYSTDGFEELL